MPRKKKRFEMCAGTGYRHLIGGRAAGTSMPDLDAEETKAAEDARLAAEKAYRLKPRLLHASAGRITIDELLERIAA